MPARPAERWVNDRYRIDAELAAGGSATVYLVYDRQNDRPAALKWLTPNRGPSDRLINEARALRALHHPRVVEVFDVGAQDGREYLVMEYLERGSLADRLASEGPLPPREAVAAMVQVLDALGAAHTAGIVHRDVKPANVLVRGDGSVALCDFGIARIDEGGETRTGMALGSVPFMAPEQRIDPRRAGPQADLYAAACCLYNLVTADTPVDLYLAADTSPRWEPVPAPLRAVLRRATRSEPSARYQTAAEMAEALSAVEPALEHALAARPRIHPLPPPGYAPTRDEPSLRAEQRERAVEVDTWRMAAPRPAPVGRSALWLGAAVTVFATATFAALGPLASRDAPVEEAPAPAAPAAPAGTVAGMWIGTVDGNPVRMELRGAGPYEGDVVLKLAAHELRTRVTGGLAEGELVLVEVEASEPQTFRARFHPSGLILEGQVERRGAAKVPFAVVRIE